MEEVVDLGDKIRSDVRPSSAGHGSIQQVEGMASIAGGAEASFATRHPPMDLIGLPTSQTDDSSEECLDDPAIRSLRVIFIGEEGKSSVVKNNKGDESVPERTPGRIVDHPSGKPPVGGPQSQYETPESVRATTDPPVRSSDSGSLQSASTHVVGTQKSTVMHDNKLYDPEEVKIARNRASKIALEAASVLSDKSAENQSFENSDAKRVPSSAKRAPSDDGAGGKAQDFSVEEQAFFNRGVEQAIPSEQESFADLDEGYELPKTFWGRFMADPRSNKRKKKT